MSADNIGFARELDRLNRGRLRTLALMFAGAYGLFPVSLGPIREAGPNCCLDGSTA